MWVGVSKAGYSVAEEAAIREGVNIRLFIATCYSVIVLLSRLVLGPGAFRRFGISWLTIIAVYYLAFSIGGLAFGALSRYRLNPVGAMARGFHFVLPVYVAFTTLIGLGVGQLPLKAGLLLGLVIAAFAGSTLGLWMWVHDTKGRKDNVAGRS